MKRKLSELYYNQKLIVSLKSNPVFRGRKALEVMRVMREIEPHLADLDKFRLGLVTKYELDKSPTDEQTKAADAEWKEAGEKEVDLAFGFTVTEPEIANADLTIEQIEQLIIFGLYEPQAPTKKETKARSKKG